MSERDITSHLLLVRLVKSTQSYVVAEPSVQSPCTSPKGFWRLADHDSLLALSACKGWCQAATLEIPRFDVDHCLTLKHSWEQKMLCSFGISNFKQLGHCSFPGDLHLGKNA